MLALAAQLPSSEIGTGYFQATHPTLSFQECSHYVVALPGDVADQAASGPSWSIPTGLDQRPAARPADAVLDELLGLVEGAGAGVRGA